MKKSTLFLDKTFQEKLRNDPGWTKAYGVALEFYSRLIAFVSNPHAKGMPEEQGSSFYRDDGPQTRFISGKYSESINLQKICLEAQRVEACLRLVDTNFVALEFRAYRRGEKESCVECYFFYEKRHPRWRGPDAYVGRYRLE